MGVKQHEYPRGGLIGRHVGRVPLPDRPRPPPRTTTAAPAPHVSCRVRSCRRRSPRAPFLSIGYHLIASRAGGDDFRPFTVRLGDGESLLQSRPLGQLQFHADAKMVWLIRRFHWLRALTSERHPACVPDWRVTRQSRWTPSAHRTSPPRCYRRYSPSRSVHARCAGQPKTCSRKSGTSSYGRT